MGGAGHDRGGRGTAGGRRAHRAGGGPSAVSMREVRRDVRGRELAGVAQGVAPQARRARRGGSSSSRRRGDGRARRPHARPPVRGPARERRRRRADPRPARPPPRGGRAHAPAGHRARVVLLLHVVLVHGATPRDVENLARAEAAGGEGGAREARRHRWVDVPDAVTDARAAAAAEAAGNASKRRRRRRRGERKGPRRSVGNRRAAAATRRAEVRVGGPGRAPRASAPGVLAARARDDPIPRRRRQGRRRSVLVVVVNRIL